MYHAWNFQSELQSLNRSGKSWQENPRKGCCEAWLASYRVLVSKWKDTEDLEILIPGGARPMRYVVERMRKSN